MMPFTERVHAPLVSVFLLVVLVVSVSHFGRVSAQYERQTDGPEAAEPPAGSSLTRCFGKFGCFSVGEPFLSVYRPINLYPLPPDALNVQFLLRTRRNENYYQKLRSGDAESFAQSRFDGTRPTAFIIHGYLEHGYQRWIMDMATELLTKDNYNVITVDWGLGSMPPYTQAVANARMVGAVISDFIQYIQERYNIAPNDIHLIGYNVGAHVAGYAGERLRGIGRITGLDPAEPYFTNTDRVVRLDPTDAEFVDVIHTGSSSFPSGQGPPVVQDFGHVDFFPNGGKPSECSEPNSPYIKQDSWIFGVRRYINCPDIRAHEFFTESINGDCPFYGFHCESYENFTTGACNLGCGPDGAFCAPMGFRAYEWRRFASETLHRRMYLTTSGSPPYCRLHYLVRLTIGTLDSIRSIGVQRGSILIRLWGSRPPLNLLETTTSTYDEFHPGRSVELLMTSSDLGRILRVTADWKPEENQIHPNHIEPPPPPPPPGPHTHYVPPLEGAAPQQTPPSPQIGKGLFIHHIRVLNLATGERFVFCGEEELRPDVIKTFFAGGDCEFTVQEP